MGRKHKLHSMEMDDRKAYVMCTRKKKMKSSEAGFYASKYNQRKYHCPVCGHWHLTKLKGEL